jgi:predicted Ser/Thr protein kinase
MEKIGKYDVVKELGRGGMGVVYKAHDSLMERDVAIKLISEMVLAVPEIKSRFLREAQTAGKLSHENITVIFDVGEDQGRPFIVMEYLEGADLGEMTDEGKDFSLPEKLDYAIQICRGLSYSHSRGIIHRDIKPGNIRVTANKKVKIMDFGIARAESSNLTRTGAIIGTPYYMSPEQVQGKKIDKRSDIFSFGVLFYELLTGRKPFPGDEPTGVMYKIVFEEPDRTDDRALSQPKELKPIVLKLLAKDPDKRYQDLSDAAADLDKILTQLRTGEWKKREEERKRIDRSIDEIRSLISGKRFKKAAEAIEKASKAFPGEADIAKMKTVLDEAEAAETRRVLIEERIVAARKAIESKEYGRAAALASEILALDAHHAEALRLQREAGDAMLYARTGDSVYAKTQIGSAPPAPTRPQPAPHRTVPPPARPAPAKAASRTPLIIGVSIGVLVAVVLLVKFFVLAPSAPQGFVALTMRPWAEVKRVVRTDGSEFQLAQPMTTPCRLALPPGGYTITVENPAYGSQALPVTVTDGSVQEINQAFPKFDAEKAVSAFQE